MTVAFMRTSCQIFVLGSQLSEAGAAEFLAEVFPFHFDDAAHFVETRAHAFSDTIAQGLRGALISGPGQSGGSRRVLTDVIGKLVVMMVVRLSL